jgi:predicted nucleic acid-binding protein
VIYFDTSFLAALILPEATSAKVATFVRNLPAANQTVSHWGRVEFSSVLARKVRTGELDAEGAVRADARFEDMMGELFAVILPAADDFGLAKHYLGRLETGLRAGDALHLAIARNRGAEAIYSLDKVMIKAGKMLGLPISSGIRTN